MFGLWRFPGVWSFEFEPFVFPPLRQVFPRLGFRRPISGKCRVALRWREVRDGCRNAGFQTAELLIPESEGPH